jgi:hypothetical protein
MAAIMAWSGFGWRDEDSVRGLAQAIAAGALTYAVVLAGCWLAAGRPNGAERDVLALVRRLR